MGVKTDTQKMDDRIAIITWSNPPVNALSSLLCDSIWSAVKAIKQDSSVTAIILTSQDSLPFSAGADIKEFDGGKRDQGNVAPLARLVGEIEGFDIPIIAAIQGFAFGGGLELALACHYRVACSKARFGLPEVKIGLIPGCGGTQRLPRLIGIRVALPMIITGTPTSAKKALNIGLVDVVDKSSDAHGALQASLDFIRQQRGGTFPVRRTRDMQVPDLATDGKDKSALVVCQEVAKTLRIAPHDRGGEAQEACIEAVAACGSADINDGLALEDRNFKRLMRSDQSKARRYNFFAERRTALYHHPEAHPLGVQKAGIIGGGTTGSGIVVSFLETGAKVILVEANAEALERSTNVVRMIFASKVKRGQYTIKQALKIEQNCKGSLSIEDLSEVDAVVEAVFEEMQLKKDIFAKLDKICPAHTILCTNTSSLSIDEIAKATNRPRQVLGMHFFSPTHIMKLVELVKGAKTGPQAIATVAAVSKAMKKVCVVVGNCHGFVGNRMLFAYKAECEFLVEEGSSPYQVDRVIYEYGFPIGPFQMADLAGLDVSLRIRKAQGLSDPAKRNPHLRDTDVGDKLCETGRLGQKIGLGWFKYEGRKALPDPQVLTFLDNYRKEKGIVPRTDITDQEILERCLFPLVNEGFKILEEHIASSASDIDVIWINGYSWPVWKGGPMYWAETQVGLPTLLATLERYHRKFPKQPHFNPSNLLRRVVRQGQSLVSKL